ncbi:hypothetical protein [Spirosoma aerolatum]|uniref:hypothetical protein n=1 Tax=Spirosoma aerolatum TaxID=1211326 RepID=UPI0009AE07C0|nr:hypothetical protein [Spirosoma aerolatum]
MITDDNKWIFIEAYLAGKLDEPALELVRQKLADDPTFRNDVLVQKALNSQLEEQQQADDNELIAKFMASQSVLTDTNKKEPGRVIPFWQPTWVRAAAIILLVVGLAWLALYDPQPQTMALTITYTQRGLGMAGDSSVKQTTFPVKFSSQGPAGGEYQSSDDSLHIYLPDLPKDAQQWSLTDRMQGGYLLKTPQGQTYQLDKETFGVRKPLVPAK